MPHLDGLGVALVVIGLTIAIAAPFLSGVRLYLQPPTTTFGRRAAIISGGAFAIICILRGIETFLGNSPTSIMLREVEAMLAIVSVMALFASAAIDKVIVREESARKAGDELSQNHKTPAFGSLGERIRG